MMSRKRSMSQERLQGRPNARIEPAVVPSARAAVRGAAVVLLLGLGG